MAVNMAFKSYIPSNFGFSILRPMPDRKLSSVSAGLNVSSSDMSDSAGYQSSKTGVSLGTSFEQYENIYFC